MIQADLFEPRPEPVVCAAPPTSGTDTSQAAADKQTPKKTERDRARIVEYLRREAGAGATDEQMQHDLNMPANTQRPRRVELVKAGRVVDTGGRRETSTGSKAIVWDLNRSAT